MLSSIHPLGERVRDNRWWVTVTAFTIASASAGALTGAVLGSLGGLVAGDWTDSARLGGIGIAAFVAGVLDLAKVQPVGQKRQVNEHWIGHYRGWIYGAAFGAQLGLGVMTYIVTWGVYATLVAEFMMGSWLGAALVGFVFGVGRSIAPLLAGWIDRPSRLTAFHGKMDRLGPLVSSSGAVATVGLGVLGTVGARL